MTRVKDGKKTGDFQRGNEMQYKENLFMAFSYHFLPFLNDCIVKKNKSTRKKITTNLAALHVVAAKRLMEQNYWRNVVDMRKICR